MGIDFKKNFAVVDLIFTTRNYLVKYTDDAGRQIEATVERTFEENVNKSGDWLVHHLTVDGDSHTRVPEEYETDIIALVKEFGGV